MSAEIPYIHKQIVRYLREVFGGDFSVHEYGGDLDDWTIDILCCNDSPWNGVASYSTIGLSDQLGWETAEGTPFGIELVGACRSETDEFPNLMASVAFRVVKDGIRCKPHKLIEGVFKDYSISSTMAHMVCVDPFIWDPRPRTLDLGQTKTTWLQLAPISEGELNLAKSHGVQAMLDRLEASNLDVLDINRASSV